MGPQIAKNREPNEADSELDTFSEKPKDYEASNLEKSTQMQENAAKPEHKYVYLEHDVLSKEFSFDRETPILEQKSHKIALCMFSINETLSSPFLNFYFENEIRNGVYKFPNTELHMETFANIVKKEDDVKINMTNIEPIAQPLNGLNHVNNEKNGEKIGESEEENEIDTEFFNQCSQFFQKTTSLTNDIASQRYLGFIEKDDIIYVFFDCSKIESSVFENMHVGIIDEIINKKRISDVPIEQPIVELFSSSPLITHIYRQHGEEIPYPKSVNLCLSDNEGQYKNAYYQDPLKTVSVVNPKVEHPFFGNVYIFSSEPIIQGSTKGLVQGIMETLSPAPESNPIKRYALFTGSAKIYKEITSLEQVDKRYICYGFIEKSHELWAVKQIKLFVEL